MKQVRYKIYICVSVVKFEAEFFYVFVLLMGVLLPCLNENIRPNKK